MICLIDNIYLKERYFKNKYREVIDLFTGKEITAVYDLRASNPNYYDRDLSYIADGETVFKINNKFYYIVCEQSGDGHYYFSVRETDRLPDLSDQEFWLEYDDRIEECDGIWHEIDFSSHGAVRRVVPYYDDEPFDEYYEKVIGFVLVYKNKAFSFAADYIEDGKILFYAEKTFCCPKYILRNKYRKCFDKMFDFVTSETERLNLPALSGKRYASVFDPGHSTNEYVRSLFSINKLELTYSPNPEMQ
ncbi:MAG: hypothetical protein IJU45_09035, partial [Clostridia bacterium]|nr:hypothetical protein [Clostridia bacterium]